MEYPRTVRCGAAFGRAVLGTVLLGYMSIAPPIYLFANGNSDGVLGIVGGGCIWVIIVGCAIAQALALQCKIIVDRDEVTFVERGQDRTMRWDEIQGFEARGAQRVAQGYVIGVDGEEFRPVALRCLQWGISPPRSLRETCELLESERRARTAASADD